MNCGDIARSRCIVDAAGAGDVAIGEIHQIELHVLGEMLVPVGAGARGGDQLLHDRLALAPRSGRAPRECRLPPPAPWSARSRPRSRAACRSRSRNAPNAGRRRSAPCCGATSARSRSRENCATPICWRPAVAVERFGKHLLADRLRFLDGLVLEAVGLPGRRIAFDQERAHVRRIAVVMRVEGAAIGRRQRSATASRTALWCRTRRTCWWNARPTRRIRVSKLRRTSEFRPSAATIRS